MWSICKFIVTVCLAEFALSRSITTQDIRSKDSRLYRPTIQPGFPENTTVLVGGQAELVCKVHRPATTRLQWFKKDRDRLGPDGSPLLKPLTPLQDKISKVNVLPLVNVTLEDAGEYVCMAKNSAGWASNSAWLEVLTEILPDKSMDQLTVAENPTEVSEELSEETSEHLLLEPGDVLKLRCDTNRPGAVHWFKGDMRVQHSARIQIRAGVMEITDATYEDSGLYVCMIRGSREALRNFTITVAGTFRHIT
ncbi:hypothetical protein PDJAM_G00060290 [Pangasius djambal]|uniref:Uncharacterized protein n=1 Tax=Pangasius djambal TaxID=1691987 RepID=A0ACC5YXG4_9TELE|nr:hypothetical protein [Pangasius djambal]